MARQAPLACDAGVGEKKLSSPIWLVQVSLGLIVVLANLSCGRRFGSELVFWRLRNLFIVSFLVFAAVCLDWSALVDDVRTLILENGPILKFPDLTISNMPLAEEPG